MAPRATVVSSGNAELRKLEMELAERLIGQPPTLEDVATRAGVSKSTVWRMINGEPTVRPVVAERIREALEKLGYVLNQAARRLVTRRNNAVAVVVTEPQNRLFVDSCPPRPRASRRRLHVRRRRQPRRRPGSRPPPRRP
ncbi:LacI family DNA-binding transcriptional regulator [Streptomyces sp. NPDC050147]|uniref:LacI family DNA-binding transcriptional regulator n=1 Tax=Streptomyces sp. NPDC050147 TaxID=3155513 RepID=UPI0034433B33